MSAGHSAGPLSTAQKLAEFLSADAAADVAAVWPPTIRANLKPDAWMFSRTGKRWPLYRPATVEAWVAARNGGAL